MNVLLAFCAGFILLVVGTVLGRYYAPDRRPLRRAAREGNAYARGLVEVLEGNQDAAIGEISKALKENSKAVEPFFALGTLFRGRGEYERAVRVHQSILVRRDIDKKTKQRVHFQLAEDFLSAGFDRRATKALEWLLTQDPKNEDVLRRLSKLYQRSGEWRRAAAAYTKLGKSTDEDLSGLIAHMHTEEAGAALAANEMDVARKALRRALSADGNSTHALHLLALYQQRKGDHSAASKAWRKALSLQPNLAAFFFPLLQEELFLMNKLEELDKISEKLLEEHPGNVHVRLAHARFDKKRNSRRAAAELLAILDEHPHLLPARREASSLVLEHGSPEEVKQAFEDLLAMLASSDRGYRCGECGHSEREIFWRCSSCESWDSVNVAWGRRSGEKA
jgi:lipopolysaccharide assembly protein B